MTKHMQTQEYLGRGPKRRGKRWVLIKFNYDPRVDGRTLGGSVELGPYEARLGSLKSGNRVVLCDKLVTVVEHSNHMTNVSLTVTRLLKTKDGKEADISGERTWRVPSSVVVSTDPREVAKFIGSKTKSEARPKTHKSDNKSELIRDAESTLPSWTKSQSNLDSDARKMVEGLLLKGGMRYSEVHAEVTRRLPGWQRSISWVSNIAYYMRKDGRLKNVDKTQR